MDGWFNNRLDALGPAIQPAPTQPPASAAPAGAAVLAPRRPEVVWLAQPPTPPGFTARDLAELERWASAERRVALCSGESSAFAMLYVGPTPWASWAVTRQDGAVLVWNCVSLADLGRFACMAAALAAVAGAGLEEGWDADANVIPFAAAAFRLAVSAR